MNVAIIDYGAGNTRSLQFALERIGVSSVLTADSDVIQHADKVIFPGQGAAQSAMEKLKQKKLDLLLPELTQPVLGICLGMQLLSEQTEEGNVNGLGILSTSVKRFSSQVKVPQMGWNSIQNLASPLFEHLSPGAFMYLVHSYFVPIVPETIAQSNYDGLYSVAVQKRNFFGVQFHPEKSSKAGQVVLQNFLSLP